MGEIASYNLGTGGHDPAFVEGAYWAVLHGNPILDDEIEATVYVDGQQTDHLGFGVWRDEPNQYRFSLTA